MAASAGRCRRPSSQLVEKSSIDGGYGSLLRISSAGSCAAAQYWLVVSQQAAITDAFADAASSSGGENHRVSCGTDLVVTLKRSVSSRGDGKRAFACHCPYLPASAGAVALWTLLATTAGWPAASTFLALAVVPGTMSGRGRSEVAYLLSMGAASLSTAVWLGRVVWKFQHHVEDPDFEIETKLGIFLVAKALLLGIHAAMVSRAWSTLRLGWYVAMIILFVDLMQAFVAAMVWMCFRYLRKKVLAERQEEKRNHRHEYLKKLPRSRWEEMEQTSCIICLTEYTPSCSVVKLDCGHIFHDSCISHWVLDEKREPCPFRCTNFPEEVDTRQQQHSGLVVVAPVEEGEALLRVPQSAVLSGKMAQQVLGVDLEPDLALVALLAEARARAEEGQDIIGLKEYLLLGLEDGDELARPRADSRTLGLSLPRHFHGLPWVFDDEEAASELRGTALQPCLQLLQAKEDENRQVLQARLGERLATAWSAERFRWAKAVVMTRAGIHEVSEDWDEAEPEPSVAIVPLIDFANCAEVPSAFCRLHKGFIELVTRQALKAGDEVTISYGEQSQEQQLFTFGFFLESSPVEIMTPLAMTVPTEVTTAVELRNVLLRLLFLERQNAEVQGIDRVMPFPNASAEGSMADLPPFAMLRARSSGLDLSELYGVATLQELPENQLRQVADEVRKTSRLALPPPSSESLKRLKALLQEWHAELSVEASSSRSGEKPVFLRAQLGVAEEGPEVPHGQLWRHGPTAGGPFRMEKMDAGPASTQPLVALQTCDRCLRSSARSRVTAPSVGEPRTKVGTAHHPKGRRWPKSPTSLRQETFGGHLSMLKPNGLQSSSTV
eukprot:g25693.t1